MTIAGPALIFIGFIGAVYGWNSGQKPFLGIGGGAIVLGTLIELFA